MIELHRHSPRLAEYAVYYTRNSSVPLLVSLGRGACRSAPAPTECRGADGAEETDVAIAAGDLSRPSRQGRIGLSVEPGGGPRGILPAPRLPVFGQHGARMAGRLGAR